MRIIKHVFCRTHEKPVIIGQLSGQLVKCILKLQTDITPLTTLY